MEVRGQHRSRPLYTRTHWTEGWVGLRIRLDDLKNPVSTFAFFRPFFSFFRCPLLSTVYVYILCPCVPYSSTAHNTNVHGPGVIRTRNRSKRLPADPRLRPLCHWDRRDSNLAIVQPVASQSLYRLRYPESCWRSPNDEIPPAQPDNGHTFFEPLDLK
jgi:hypothetical protein